MPAALWKDLIFHVKRRSAGAFVFHHGSYAAFHFAVAGVGIGDDREFGCIADFTDGARHFRQGDQPNIGISAHIGGGATRDVARFESSLRHRARHQCIECAGNHDGAALPRFAKSSAGMRCQCRHRCGSGAGAAMDASSPIGCSGCGAVFTAGDSLMNRYAPFTAPHVC